MIKVFIDTNIFLDLFLNRDKHADAAETLLTWCQQGNVEGTTSAINIVNLYYLIHKEKNKAEARRVVKILLDFITVPETNHKDLLLAIESEFSDFEDAVQYYTSLNVFGLNYIITRNKKDYKHAAVDVLSAEEFVKKFG